MFYILVQEFDSDDTHLIDDNEFNSLNAVREFIKINASSIIKDKSLDWWVSFDVFEYGNNPEGADESVWFVAHNPEETDEPWCTQFDSTGWPVDTHSEFPY